MEREPERRKGPRAPPPPLSTQGPRETQQRLPPPTEESAVGAGSGQAAHQARSYKEMTHLVSSGPGALIPPLPTVCYVSKCLSH